MSQRTQKVGHDAVIAMLSDKKFLETTLYIFMVKSDLRVLDVTLLEDDSIEIAGSHYSVDDEHYCGNFDIKI